MYFYVFSFFRLTLTLHLVKLGLPLYIPDVQQTVQGLGHTRSGYPGQSGQCDCGTVNCFRHTRNLDGFGARDSIVDLFSRNLFLLDM